MKKTVVSLFSILLFFHSLYGSKNPTSEKLKQSIYKDHTLFFNQTKNIDLKESLLNLSDSFEKTEKLMDGLRDSLEQVDDTLYPPQINFHFDKRQIKNNILILNAFREKKDIINPNKRVVYICSPKSVDEKPKIKYLMAPSKRWLISKFFLEKNFDWKKSFFGLLTPEQIDSFPIPKKRKPDDVDKKLEKQLIKKAERFWEKEKKEETRTVEYFCNKPSSEESDFDEESDDEWFELSLPESIKD